MHGKMQESGAHWNHSFHMHLSSLGLIQRVFPSWGSKVLCQGWLQRLTARGAWQWEGPLSPSWVPMGLPRWLSCTGLKAATSLVYRYGRQYFSFQLLTHWFFFVCFLSSTQDLLLVLVAVWGADGEWNPSCHSSLYIVCVLWNDEYSFTQVVT